MKTLFTALASSLMLLGSAAAFAASTVDLTVKGLIVPVACTPTLPGGNVIDLGKRSAKDLTPNNPTLIDTRTLTMTVSCSGKALIALHSVDNRKGSSISATDYGLGLINGTQKLGWFQLSLSNPSADGVAVQTIASFNGQDNWSPEKAWDAGLYISVADMSDSTQPIPVQDLTMDMTMHTTIARTDGLDLSNEVDIDGSATLEVKYL